MNRHQPVMQRLVLICLLAALTVGRSRAEIVLDGEITSEEYLGSLVAVQTVPTGFGDLASELDAAFAVLDEGRNLHLGLTGNLTSTSGPGGYNSIILLIDSRAGGVIASQDELGYGFFPVAPIAGMHLNDFTGFNGSPRPLDANGAPDPANLAFPDGAYAATSLPSVLDPGFNPDFAITLAGTDEIQNGLGEDGYQVRVIDLSVAADSQGADLELGNVINFDGTPTNFDVAAAAAAASATAPSTPGGIIMVATNGTNEENGVIAFDDFNTSVPTPGSGLEGDPLTAVEGFEYFLSAEFLDNDGQDIKLLPIIGNGAGDYLSNQLLADDGLPAGTGNLAFGVETTEGWDAATNAAMLVSGEAYFDGVGYSILDPDGVFPLFDAREYPGSQFITIAVENLQPGDFDDDGLLTAEDIDALSVEVRAGTHLPAFDLSQDGFVDDQDRRNWVVELKRTYFGDADLNGEFNSSDLVAVLQIGEYEDDQPLNSTWADGDWNGDGESDSADLVTALADGGYEQGPRPGVRAVPEPSGAELLLPTLIVAIALRSQSRVPLALPVLG
jgi:hypothetical protein